MILHILDYIEDTKGNPRDGGRLFVTNLRIIWYSLTHSKFNLCELPVAINTMVWYLCYYIDVTNRFWGTWRIMLFSTLITAIGLGCILSMTTKTVLSKLRGTTQALYILTSSSQSRFEFIFTNMAIDNTRQFSSVFDIYKFVWYFLFLVLSVEPSATHFRFFEFRLYQSSVLYRELKLRSAVVSSQQLKVLPQEQVYSTVSGIWNLSSDQGNLGTFVITNVRLVWFADINENFNISLPYMQMGAVRNNASETLLLNWHNVN